MKYSQSELDDLDSFVRSLVTIDRKQAIDDQLDMAIRLWFYEQDLASIHTLTVAAQGILESICRDEKVHGSILLEALESRPKSLRDQIRSPQNFFKHGHHKQRRKGMVYYTGLLAEMFIMDNIATYQRLFDETTPFMMTFALRFSLVHPEGLPLKAFKFSDTKFPKAFKIEDFARLEKPDFFEKVLPLILRRKRQARSKT